MFIVNGVSGSSLHCINFGAATDPAAGSGNFLTETYLSLRKLENEILKLLLGEQIIMDISSVIEGDIIKVSISQFHGIEINDFAVTVAKTAMWIAEAQMMQQTQEIIHQDMNFLPLKTNANIVEGNALRIDWKDVVPKDDLNYIMGNPPFLGYSMQTASQKEDIRATYVDENGKQYKTAGKIDYVAGWYFKAAQLAEHSNIQVAFVSTNSITQGEQVASIWEPLYKRFGVHINFAHRTFIWDSEASIKAQVHCVIIGFSTNESKNSKVLFDHDTVNKVKNINAYLLSAPDVFVHSIKNPICDVLPMTTGNRPADGGHLIIEVDDYDEFIKEEPGAIKYIKKLTGATEYINNKERYCLWLVNASPSELIKMPMIMKRVEACKQDRLAGAPDRQKLADTPMLFRETKNPSSYIIVPRVSSENRRYIPLGFLDKNVIPTDSATIIIDAGAYEFGILTSNIHMSWMRAVCGRLKSDYRYSKDIVYNNFPWPNPTDAQRAKIENTAQAILDARALYPDCSLADMYGEQMYLFPELLKAHQQNDIAVMAAYGITPKDEEYKSESACVAMLMRMYQELVDKEK